jgi:hypothetical protein
MTCPTSAKVNGLGVYAAEEGQEALVTSFSLLERSAILKGFWINTRHPLFNISVACPITILLFISFYYFNCLANPKTRFTASHYWIIPEMISLVGT